MSSESQAGEHHFTEEIMMEKDEDRGRPLQHISTSGTTVTMTPEMFEKLYLTPKTPRVGDNVKRFANPTPIGLVGFVISTMTFSMVLMEWGGANGLYGVAGIFFFTGPVLLVLALIFEWIMSNFFPMMVMGLFAVFWLSFGLLQLPTLNLAAAYSSTGTNMAEGLASKEYNAVVGIYCVVWGFALLTFFVFTLRTNVVFASIFGLVTVGIWVLAGAYFRVSTGDFEMAGRLQKGGAALLFVVGLLGWYMTVVIMAAEMRMGFNLPVGDLSHYWPKTDTELGKEEV